MQFDPKKPKQASSKARNESTPLMKQYWSIKEKYPDSILFFRLGDFYEMFFEDAKIGAKVLGIALTSRDKKSTNPVPLCGVPYHSSQSYISKLLDAGHKVAICEQVEDAGASKGIVKREVVKVLTPGLRTDEEGLDPQAQNYILSVVSHRGSGKDSYTVASLDYASGLMEVISCAQSSDVRDLISKLEPMEVLCFEHEAESKVKRVIPSLRQPKLEHIPSWVQNQAKETLKKKFGVMDLSSLGIDLIEQSYESCAALYYYVENQNQASVEHIQKPSAFLEKEYVSLDHSTVKHLELIGQGKSQEGSLFSVLNHCQTSMGARALKSWIVRPLRDVDHITSRLDAVEELCLQPSARHQLAKHLSQVYDIERILSRISSNKASLRDLISLGQSLEMIPHIVEQVQSLEASWLKEKACLIDPHRELSALLSRALDLDEQESKKEVHKIRDGYDAELDRLRDIARGNRSWIVDLEKKEKQATGISSLKLGYNKVFGYFIEVTKLHLQKVPEHYIRKQTLSSAERFVTPELKAKEQEIEHSKTAMENLEQELFSQLRQKVSKYKESLRLLAFELSQLDALISLAESSSAYGYIRPEFSQVECFEVTEGRHPVVERHFLEEPFVPNSLKLGPDQERIALLTGPNMAGKSTVMRQMALITVMAQIGCFVPARKVRLSTVDRIFTRIGASDDLSKGRSTFMVEMSEAAHILSHATSKSLILLDELGRGTSTYDGLSIAWAILEDLQERVGAKTIFATHYHELTALAQDNPRLVNLKMTIKEWDGNIVFLRKLEKGTTEKSYGIEVARLAGVRESVVLRAKQVLLQLESASASPSHVSPAENLEVHKLPESTSSTLEQVLSEIDPNELSPRQALEKLFELKNL